MDEFISIISQLGFPIAVAIGIFYFATKFIEGQVKQYGEREDKLIQAYNLNLDRFTSQIDRFNETLSNFNITLTKIDARLQVLEEAILKEEDNN